MPDDAENVPERRRSRFDRPKEPHDWRWVLGHIGRTLVAIGILMFAFVAYQLWGTGIQTAREQNRLRHEFAEQLESTVPLTTLPTPTTVAPPPDNGVDNSVAPIETTTSSLALEDVPPPVVAPPEEGGAVAQLIIPRMGIENKIVVEGVTPTDLQDGPGHFPETPLPGQLGNSAIAGHRTTHGQPFHDIDKLVTGDDITVVTLAGRYVYVVTGQTIVDPSDYSLVIPTIDPTKATLTLTSCHPAHSTKHRIVVFAELDVARSSPVTLPSEPSTDQPSALPSEDDADQTAATTQPSATDPPTTAGDNAGEAITTEPTSTEPSSTEPTSTEPTGDVVEPPADSAEVFQNEWFSDPDAFPQVALWGFGLIAVAFGAYAVSRRARRNWVGLLAGILPFVVVLYFWFENVNRLLPPNL